MSSFVAYIDESGDERFTFPQDGTGRSSWFVLWAVVFWRPNELLTVDPLKRARDAEVGCKRVQGMRRSMDVLDSAGRGS